ncbi:helix-turn-helix domain-containing protein [Gordonia sp. PKS22-38]|uniref:Helix-turn-helix domain-containing protein n=1 Tax=Gordonia prachuapensis TaxID=3115651 RepID=A0ABU7MPQ0_9ACTN|nr:helix-turn-helix domain-containing protein [Gordonia sp. PKS22-38]
MIQVRALALDGVSSFDLACAVQTFARGPEPAGRPDGFELTVCGPTPGIIPSPDGFDLQVSKGLEALSAADIIIVPGRHPVDAAAPTNVIDALHAAHARGTIVASICIGAFVLAQAGLLDGRDATTHWAYTRRLADEFPAIRVHPEPLYIDDGDILTSAGLAAGLDLCLHIVRRTAGTAAAARLARWNVVGPHREGGQAQFIPCYRPPVSSAGLGPVQSWIRENLDKPLALDDIAARVHISTRTLNRRFLAEVGMTPKQWIIEQRVAAARELLEDDSISIETVARRTGFPSTTALRKQLRIRTSSTPSGYRRTFAERSANPDTVHAPER